MTFLSMFWDQGQSSFCSPPPNKATHPTHGPNVDPWRIRSCMKVSSNRTFFVVVFFILSIQSQFISQDCSLLDQKRSICSIVAHGQDTGSWWGLWGSRTMCVMRGPLHAPLYVREHTCSWVSVCRSSMVLSVKPHGAPGVGQGSEFMPSTAASLNLLLRWLRTRVALFIDEPLHDDPVLLTYFSFLHWSI